MAQFLQLSDLHVVEEGALASSVLDTRRTLTAVIDRLLEMKAALDPLDALLVSGDISDDGSADSYAFARAELERLDMPIYVVPGNHDAREPFRAAFANLDATPPSGLIDWATTIGDTLVVGLDTLVEGQGGGRLREDSLDLLRNALDTAGQGPVVIMLHHPPIKTGIRFMDAIGLENAEALEAELADTRCDITLIAGHVHGIHHGRLGHHRVATAPSVCSGFALDLRASATVGFLTGPTGCAFIDTAPGGIWSAVPLDPSDGPFPF
ncbi:metallophosphoesterase [Ruegeria atlantica]|uniref:3',5'-cyclic adenosine monophosphate phosphodiesterase CpdA n=1 Tax=Ruegeria atlantica TaxID=81569 RepID=A0A0P1EFV0_9RHOB|nr:metallophosphoesterase [Ruegeria atlantica]CUH48851.1 3',5'-cyclic adenosine monophosphate phosphodiesterase CpdA [Ruegeria atlantica]